MPAEALLFDFDGVIADSEALSNTVLAEFVTGLGLPMTRDEAIDRYMGKRWAEAIVAIERDLGHPVPPSFVADLTTAIHDRCHSDLREVAGVSAFLEAMSALPRAIASSSTPASLALCLRLLGLSHWFGGHVYSAELVERGKPHPDIYLHAASRLGVAPAACIVVEDSTTGVRAGCAAGMTVIGLCAGSHIRPGHDARLREAGAHHVAASWAEAERLIVRMM
ncbi:MAG TPA: HAD family phosphatase [Sphingomonadaceae bacterium]|jgi:HAD superfamily hydrolase (TIGR01509 family)|nr:HAD family phosphatase [Sphingomonadaceae bacterium]